MVKKMLILTFQGLKKAMFSKPDFLPFTITLPVPIFYKAQRKLFLFYLYQIKKDFDL